jgi:hypothetical protein
MTRWKAGQPVPAGTSTATAEIALVSDAPTLLTVRREARQTVHLGAYGCKTFQMVAGACFQLIATWLSPSLARTGVAVQSRRRLRATAETGIPSPRPILPRADRAGAAVDVAPSARPGFGFAASESHLIGIPFETQCNVLRRIPSARPRSKSPLAVIPLNLIGSQDAAWDIGSREAVTVLSGESGTSCRSR